MNYLLIIVLLIFAWSIFEGGKKGFLRGLFGLISWVLVLVACNVATPKVAEYIIEETMIDETIEEVVSEKVYEIIVNGTVEELQENIPAEMIEFLQTQGIHIEEVLATNSQAIAEALEIENMIINVVSFIIVLVISGILVVVIDKVLGVTSKLPIIGPVDRFFGIICGGAKAIIVCWVLLAVISMTAMPGGDIDWVGFISDSQLLTWLQENNYILKMLVMS